MKGTLSMARTDDPNSASTSFFICTGRRHHWTASTPCSVTWWMGWRVVEAIDAAPVDGETPTQRLEVTKVTVRTE